MYDTTCGTPAAPCIVTSSRFPLFFTDVFVTKFNASGTALVYSTFLGGIEPRVSTVDHAAQEAAAIRVDAAGRATVTGFTNATDFPVVAAIQPALLGSSDAFVSRFSADGRSLEFSTYLGGGSTLFSSFGLFDLEGAVALALGPGGDVWVAGHTFSTDFPVTPDANQPTAGGGSDAFVTAINVSDPTLVIDLPAGEALTAPINVQGWAIDRAWRSTRVSMRSTCMRGRIRAPERRRCFSAPRIQPACLDPTSPPSSARSSGTPATRSACAA